MTTDRARVPVAALQRHRHAPRCAKSYTDQLARELADFVKWVGGVRAAEKLLSENAGTLLHVARGTRRATPALRERFWALGWRSYDYQAGALAILAWAEQPAPRKRWTSYAGKAR